MLKNTETLEPIGFTPQAFELRDGEDHLSASWVQYFPGARKVGISAAMDEFARVFEIKAKDRFAVGVVGAIKVKCAEQGVKVRIVHDGKGYPSHAAVRQISGSTLELFGLLASQAWAEMVAPPPSVIATSKTSKKARS